MYDFIIGKIESKEPDSLVILNNGIGYKILVSKSTLLDLELGETSKIYINMVVREDDISLYGFSSTKEREVYKLLTTVRGIGPRVAIGILSGITIDSLISSIRNSDVNILTTAPGVGKKTAERIILELKDKTEHIPVEGIISIKTERGILQEAEEALVSLGYSSYEVLDVLKSVYNEEMNIEQLIREGLKQMTR
ncbi:MAG: Holliday junction branch migration protein RuvA [Tissierellia bacterium]|jgi:Holliday junction DNA helicase RuvA|nr:Holliday junction branch migration protein RuvA [Tissierellia bacterium]